MSKQSGLGATFLIGGYDLSGDISSLDSISGGPAALDVTSIKALANERLGGERDGDLQFTSWFDVALGQEHPVLSALPRADTVAMGYFGGAAVGSPAFAINGKQLNYDGTRGDDGSFSFKAEVQADGFGLEWGELLTAGQRTDTTATTGSAHDDGGSGTAFGAQAYLMVTGFTGTSVTVEIDHCTTSGGTYTALMTFAAATGVGAQRISVSNTTTVNEFLKVKTTGTFTSARFAVLFVRNPIAGVSF